MSAECQVATKPSTRSIRRMEATLANLPVVLLIRLMSIPLHFKDIR